MFDISKKLKDRKSEKARGRLADQGIESAPPANSPVYSATESAPTASQEPAPVNGGDRRTSSGVFIIINSGKEAANRGKEAGKHHFSDQD